METNYNKSKTISKHILSVLLNKERTEDGEFIKWRVENKYAEKSIKELSDEKMLSEKLEVFKNVNVEKSSQILFDKITNVEKRKKNRKIFFVMSSVAASVLLFMMIFNQLVVNDRIVSETEVEKSIKEFENIPLNLTEKTAILVLQNGDKISLSSGENEEVKNCLAQTQNDTTPSKNKIITPPGVTYTTELSDGTKVWMNENSELVFPVKFMGDTREVALFGEAYFEVAGNKNLPFIVNSQNNSKIKVLGTKFNINTNENKTYTTLVEGSVEVQSKDKKIVIKPSEQAIVSSENNNIIVSEVDVNRYIAWKDGKYVFVDEKISNIMKKISMWYNVDIEYDNNETTPNIELTGSLRKFDTLQKAIEVMEATNLIEIKIKNGKSIRIYAKNNSHS